MRRSTVVGWLLTLLSACSGSIEAPGGGDPPGEGGTGGSVMPPSGGDWWMAVPNPGVRRLSVKEVDSTLQDLLGDASRPAATYLPEDLTLISKNEVTPFDNDSRIQQPSGTLLGGLEAMATVVAEKLMSNPTDAQKVVACTPAAGEEAKCMRSFLTRVGRRLLRRPMTAAEMDLYVSSFLTPDVGDFRKSVELALRALLMEPEFLYRIEIGTPVLDRPGLYRLTQWEIAARLSFLIWGAAPDDELLDRAQNGALGTPEAVGALAMQMLGSARGQANARRFHALWLGYENLQRGDQTAAMKAETSALVDQVVFKDNAPWADLFTSTRTFVSRTLAQHYGIPAPPTKPDWVTYPATGPGGTPGRRGLLSHGTFLAIAGVDNNETLMTIRRGKLIRERLFGGSVPAKPAILPTEGCMTAVASPCKWEQSAPRRNCSKCAGCHALLDTVGFGLDNFDAFGKARTTIPTKNPNTDKEVTCPVHGEGVIDGNTFRGPAQLADLLAASGLLETGLVRQYLRFAIGRPETEAEQPFVADLTNGFTKGDRRFTTMVSALTSSESFLYRRQ